MRNLIVGTAGHIDHGKTSLVRALTGIDTDRLEEEKRRGISIDLGFANLDLDGVRIGLIDVPGHERFIKNMLAGASGIDLVLFVIAADESIKPQTREHFDICRLLQIPRGIVVLTKSDLVDSDILELVRLEVEEFVAGSFLEGAPVLAVSSTTGAGLPELKSQLAALAAGVTQKDSHLRARLPIDRAFSMKGFGTVVTGTLTAGSISVESELQIHPIGRLVRVRGLHVHGALVKRAGAGQRTAVNLAGIEPADIARGMVLTEPGSFEAVASFEAQIELLPSVKKPLRHGSPVHLHLAAAEVEAEIRLLQNEPLRPGSRAFARVILKGPLLALPGDRFVIRMFSPVVTIGGGTIIDILPPKRLNRAQAAKRLERLASQSPAGRLAEYVRESGGLSLADIVRRTGWPRAAIDANVTHSDLVLLTQPQWWLMSREWSAAKLKSIRETLQQFHKTNPLQPGFSKEELRSRLLPGAPAFLLDTLIAGSREITSEAEFVRLTSHKVIFKEDEDAALAKIETAFEQAGLAVPSTAEVLNRCGVEPARAKSLLQILIKQQKLVKVGDELVFHSSAIAALREILAGRKGQRFGVPEFKEWTGISRKYAIPLLEFLDRTRITSREGDSRVVL